MAASAAKRLVVESILTNIGPALPVRPYFPYFLLRRNLTSAAISENFSMLPFAQLLFWDLFLYYLSILLSPSNVKFIMFVFLPCRNYQPFQLFRTPFSPILLLRITFVVQTRTPLRSDIAFDDRNTSLLTATYPCMKPVVIQLGLSRKSTLWAFIALASAFFEDSYFNYHQTLSINETCYGKMARNISWKYICSYASTGLVASLKSMSTK